MLRLLTDQEITTIYQQWMINDFPDNELKPLEMIIQNEKEYSYGYFEDDELLGYCILLLQDHHCILDYLGVDQNKRNQGIGSKILNELKELFPDTNIIIESEKPYDDLSRRRLQFYHRNGFVLNQMIVHLYYVDYYIFSNQILDTQGVYKIYQALYPPRILQGHLKIKECITSL